MKNSKLRRVLMLVACAVLLVCLSVGATLAYLTSATSIVQNTFVVGEGINITLDEAYVYAPGDEPTGDMLGKEIPAGEEGAGRGDANEYKLVPAWTYDKDPTVHLLAGSGDCYLFVKVENGIVDIEAVDDPDTADVDESLGQKTIAQQMADNGWVALTGVDNVYFYGKVDSTNGDVVSNKATDADPIDFLVFSSFTIKNLDSIGSNYATANNATAKVTIDAFAIQADGFANAAAAWTAGAHTWGN